jgi:hypothetical protein
VKRVITILAALIVVLAVVGCASAPKPAPPTTTAKFEIAQHKGTTLGVAMPPPWVEAAVNGPKTVEKIAEYKDQFVVVVDQTGQSLDGVQLAAQRLNADTEIARYLSLRVKDTFAGAQVGDKDKIETYMERCVKSVADAKFSGFSKSADWWVQLRWFKPDKPKVFDHDEYRVIQLYTIKRETLETQLQKILSGEAANEP